MRIHEYLAPGSFTYEILVVLHSPASRRNRGRDYTVNEVMLKATERIRLFTETDTSTDIAHFEKMKPLFDRDFDVVITLVS
ncbi:MAG: hypothetical protein ACREQ2_03675 [Candidatus Binatia bacterium]